LPAGDFPVAGNPVPGDVPATGSARFAAVANALASPFAFVEDAPITPPGAMNCDRAQTVATVVTSLIVNCVVVLVDSWLHTPTAVASPIPAFVDPEPTCPPRATKYNIDDELQLSPEEIVKTPLASVVTGDERSAVAPAPLPPIPVAYTWTLAPEIGWAPASTFPDTSNDGVEGCGVVGGVVVGGVVVGGVVSGVVRVPHPERDTIRTSDSANVQRGAGSRIIVELWAFTMIQPAICFYMAGEEHPDRRQKERQSSPRRAVSALPPATSWYQATPPSAGSE
jgi:hypothetical protein